jgi:RNA polymerase sigma-70 factor (ECF subfamily)
LLELNLDIEAKALKVFEWRRCPDPEGKAAELTESLMEKLLKLQFMNYDDTKPFWPWMDAVVANRCTESSRQQIHHNDLLWKQRYRLLPLPPFKQPDDAAALKELRPVIREAVDQLPKHYREVIRLRFYEGLTRSEAANVLAVSKQTISNWTFQALSRLSQILNPKALSGAA